MCKAVRWEADNWPGPSRPVVLGSDITWDEAEKIIGADMKVRSYNQKRLHEGFWTSWDRLYSGPVIHYEIAADNNPLQKMGS